MKDLEFWVKEFGEESRGKLTDLWAQEPRKFTTELSMRKFLTEVVTGKKHAVVAGEVVLV